MRILLLSLCLGLCSLNTYSQSKLQGAGKVSKVGATSTTQKKQSESTKPSATKKPASSSPQTKRSSGVANKHASSGYMEIYGISFANTDIDGAIIDNYDSKLYAKEVRYLKPRISYKGLTSEEKDITLDVKILDEEGKLNSGSGSPDGYTYSKDVTIEPGAGNYLLLSGWGRSDAGSYDAGLYKIEIWYKNKMLYQKEVRLYSGSTPIASNDIFSINNIIFANTDTDGNILSDYGKPLYADKVQYLKPKIYYHGKYSSEQEASINVRYINSAGKLVRGSSSPVGFSFKQSVTIKPGSNSITLSGFGNTAATNYKEGICNVEIWLDGEKIYETSVEIVKEGSAPSYGESADFLKRILEKPMGIGNSNPITDSFKTVRNSVSSMYNIDDERSTSDTDKLYIWGSDNTSTRDFTYHGLSFHHYYFSIFKGTATLQRRVKYEFRSDKSVVSSLSEAYSKLDLIVRDFQKMGYDISYQKKNDKYIKAEGNIRIGKIEYELKLEEYSSYFEFAINMWVYKK